MMKTKYKLLLVLFIASQLLFSQNKWNKTFGENNRYDMTSRIIQTYDGGTLLLSYYYYLVNGKYQKYVWLIKTDANGNQLWDKVIDFPGTHYIWPMGITETFDQGYVIVGMVVDEADNVYPIAFKLNKCMTIEWSHIYINSGNASTPAFIDAVELSDHSLVFYAFNFGELPDEEVMLFKLNDQGNLIWQKVVCGSGYPTSNMIIRNIYKDGSDNIFLPARGFWEGIRRPIGIKIDSDGNELWVTPVGVDEEPTGGALDGVISSAGPIMFGYGILGGIAGDWAIQFNDDGEIINQVIRYPIEANESFEWYYNSHCTEVQNGELSLGGLWTYENFPTNEIPPSIISTISIDNLFDYDLVFNSSIIYEDLFSYGQYHQLTKDSTQILSTYDIPCGGNGRDIYFTKYNSDLSEAPIDNTPYLYDTACPFGIQSGFIVLDQCVPVSTKETPNPNEYYAHLKTIPINIYPNPASHIAKIELENTEHHNNISLEITDLMGKKISQQKIQKSQTETTLNVESWERGIYFVVVKSEGEVVGRAKLVVQ